MFKQRLEVKSSIVDDYNHLNGVVATTYYNDK